jgi:hypothetical protein
MMLALLLVACECAGVDCVFQMAFFGDAQEVRGVTRLEIVYAANGAED